MREQKQRILIYTTCYLIIDGVTLTLRKIEQEILKAGHEVMILTSRSGDLKNTHMNGEHPNRQVVFLDNSVEIPFLTDPNNPECSYHLGFSISRKTQQKIHDFSPTLIHISCPDCINIHLIEYARKMHLPIMGTYHSNIPEYLDHYPYVGWLKVVMGLFFRHQYNFLQALYVPTPYIRKHLEKAWTMQHVTQLRIWGRGIDLNQFNPQHLSYKWRKAVIGSSRPADDVPIILWVGRLVPEKRVDVFGAIVKELTRRGVVFQAVVIGAGPAQEDIMCLPNTTFLGWQGPDELKVAYASSDVFLFPSGVETFGNVTLEAAASGLPLVVNEGCSGHLVNHGVNGYGCKSYEDFLEGTLQLTASPGLRRRFSQASRELSLKFEKTTVVKKMLDNYADVQREFYEHYGGRHANRDAEYMENPRSFTGGNYPRPLLLMLTEHIFVLVFTTGFSMLKFFNSLVNRIMPQSPVVMMPKQDMVRPEKSVAVEEATNSTSDEDSFGSELSSLNPGGNTTTMMRNLPPPTPPPVVESKLEGKPAPWSHRVTLFWMHFMFFLFRIEAFCRTLIFSPSVSRKQFAAWIHKMRGGRLRADTLDEESQEFHVEPQRQGAKRRAVRSGAC